MQLGLYPHNNKKKKVCNNNDDIQDGEENQMCEIIATTITDQTFDISEQTRCQ